MYTHLSYIIIKLTALGNYRVSMASVASILSGEKLADLISITYHYKEW